VLDDLVDYSTALPRRSTADMATAETLASLNLFVRRTMAALRD
jgi:hypothetical protein